MARARSRVRGKPSLPDGAILAYKRILFAALDEAQERIERLIAPKLKKIEQRADAKPKRGALDVTTAEISIIFQRVDRHAAGETKRLIGLPTSIPKKLEERFRKENVALIKSIAEDQLDQVTELLDDAFEAGDDVDTVRAKVKERFDVSKSRADLIARDQVLKLNSQITQARQRSVGIESYIWSTSNDERVRPGHDDLEGETFRWDDPPVTNEEGDRNHPGEDYQCRCVAIPVLPEAEEGD
jgi:SPP1 gp7 family putative phage head morphogenesis protein